MGHIRYVASTLLILTACGSASASVTWTCALSNDALNLVCAASADAAGMRVVNARPLAVVNGCEFPLNPTEMYTVPLYSQPTKISMLGTSLVRERRDNPADASQGSAEDAETELLGDIIRNIPDRVGATVILVDHDMSLVQACCDWTAVLDFGRLLASGPTSDVLRDPNVMKAYLGTEEVAL